MRNTYTSPEIEILYVSEDIITTSGEYRLDSKHELPDILLD